MKQSFQIGKGLKLKVIWYDHVPEPRRETEYQGEVIGWRDSQLIVRVIDYAVLRFWKRNGLEVGNAAHERRGFRLDLSDLNPAAAATESPTASGVSVKLDA